MPATRLATMNNRPNVPARMTTLARRLWRCSRMKPVASLIVVGGGDRPGASRSELHPRHGAVGLVGLEQLPVRERAHLGHEHTREGVDLVVVAHHRVVVE